MSARAPTLETSERIVIGRGNAGEACQITNGNFRHALTADGLAEKTRETTEASGTHASLSLSALAHWDRILSEVKYLK